MFKNKLIRYSTIAMLIAILAYFFVENFSGNSGEDASIEEIKANPQTYISKIEAERKAKDEQFKSGDDSPIADKAAFHGLHYFKVNPEFLVKANIVPYTGDEKELTITYTDSTSDKYIRYGYAHFTLNGHAEKLLLLENDGTLSVLFKDETSGKETYGGGRYMDYPVSGIKNNTILLDFNKAYNPYCAYQENFACPVPPKENKLTASVFAGEQTEDGAH